MEPTQTKAPADTPQSTAPGLSDAQLVFEVLRKDRKATADFVNRHADHVYGYIRRRLIPHTEFVDDLVQEVFLAAWENLEKFREDSSLRSWLLGIARHKVEDHYRKSLREIPVSLTKRARRANPLTHSALSRRSKNNRPPTKPGKSLPALPQAYSVVLLWRYWEKRSLSEIAEGTGKTEKAVERLLARAREQFKRKWNER